MNSARKKYILDKLDEDSFVKVSELQRDLGVTLMTVRRDLNQLEEEGYLIRVHGGAQKVEKDIPVISTPNIWTLKHKDRRLVNADKKERIAQKAASLIQDNDIVFISASTTNERIAQYMKAKNVKIVTNCLYIFFLFYKLEGIDAVLIGGRYDDFLESFLGTITYDGLSKVNFTKAFVGTNAITDNNLYASNEEEGLLHKLALDNATERYVVCDSTKFNTNAFFKYYDCRDLTAIITDRFEIDKILEYREITNII